MHVSNAQLRAEIRAHQRKIRAAEWQREFRARTAKGTQGQHPQRGTRVSEELGRLLLAIATHLAERPNFQGYSFRQDMISDAMLALPHAVEVFDLSRTTNGRPSSAFAYCTQTCWYSFLATIRREARRGIVYAGAHPLEVSALPTLTLGQFDAGSLQDALQHLEA
jgi:hypothetical protein